MTQSNLPGIIGTGNTYIPLLAVQQRPHSLVYQMPVREHGSAAEATAASLAARARLNPTPRRSLPRPASRPLPPVYCGDDTAPMNMLTTPSWRFLVTLASARTGVSVADIMGKNRKHAVAAARHEAVALVYAYTNKSMVSVGKMFGGLDHTTVLHIVRKLKAVKLIEPDLKPAPSIAPPKPKPIGTALQRAVRRAYKHNVPPSALAEEYGCSVLSVKVIAHRLGLRRNSKPGVANS